MEFYLDIDEANGLEMVHVADPKPRRRQPEFLVKDIARQAFALCALHWPSMPFLAMSVLD